MQMCGLRVDDEWSSSQWSKMGIQGLQDEFERILVSANTWR